MSTTTSPTAPSEAQPAAWRGIAALGALLGWEGWALWILLAELAGACLLHAVHRGHLFISQADEAAHAVVAEHLAAHPLTPTLYEVGALSQTNSFDWEQYHIWLHIPPLGMWASAAAIRVLGATPYANRLPGLFFVLGGMVVVYVLGRRLFGPAVGLVGAAFAGFTPYALLISQGYYFGDTTDTPLMLLTPLVVLGLVLAYQSGKLRWLVVAGVAQGLCYLDKGTLGLAPTAIMLALVAFDLAGARWPAVFPTEDGWARMGWRGLAVFAGSLAVVALPYNVYTTLAFPAQSAQQAQVWKANLFTSVENWGRPPDYHLTTYLYALYGPALALLLLVAGAVVVAAALRRRARADLVLAVWIAAIYLPLSVAVSKAVPYTYPAIPALGLAVGRLVQLGLRAGPAGPGGKPGSAASQRAERLWGALARFFDRRTLTLGLLLGTAVAPVAFAPGLAPYQVSYAALQSPSLKATQSFLDRLLPYLYLLGASVAATCAIALLLWLASRLAPGEQRLQPLLASAVVGLTALALGAYWLSLDVPAVAAIPGKREPVGQGLGAELAAHTPSNATIIATQHDEIGFYHLELMFWSNRDIYVEPDLQPARVCALARRAAAAGSPLYVATGKWEVPKGAARWQLQATVGAGIWGIYQPGCT